jgi:hypothetical protein
MNASGARERDSLSDLLPFTRSNGSGEIRPGFCEPAA